MVSKNLHAVYLPNPGSQAQNGHPLKFPTLVGRSGCLQLFHLNLPPTGRRICIQWISSIQGLMTAPGTKRKTPLRLHTSGLEQNNNMHFAGLKRSQPQGNLAANWGITHQPACKEISMGPAMGIKGKLLSSYSRGPRKEEMRPGHLKCHQ